MRAALRRLADRHGLWAALGVGRGAAGLDCDVCSSPTTRAYSVQATLGMRVSPRLLVGAETFAWLDVMGKEADRVAKGTQLVARLYRSDASRLFAQGGIGVASFELEDSEVAFRTRSAAVSIGAGYDWRVERITVTPSVSMLASVGGRLESDRTGNAITEHARLGLLRGTVSLSWFR